MDIFELKSKLISDKSKVTLVKLVYSLAVSGKSRKISLNEKLKALSLRDEDYLESETLYLDNPKIPSFLYLLGFLLGDGSIFIRIRLTSSGSLTFIPLLIFPQKSSENNIHMYTMMSKFFQNLGIKSYVTYKKGEAATLYVEGLKAVAPVVPLFQESLSLGYLKSDNISLLIEFFKYHSAGVQTFRSGLIVLLNILYKYPNKRERNLDEWVKAAEAYFQGIDEGYISGNHLIQPLRGRGDKVKEFIA